MNSKMNPAVGSPVSHAPVSLEKALARSSVRYWLYGFLCLFLFTRAVLIGVDNGPNHGMPFTLVESDGRFYYAYLTTLVIDGDLDFTNQIKEHWDTGFSDEFLNLTTPIGRVRNKYSVGLALTLAPAFLLGHAVVLLSNNDAIPADGYSWPYQVFCLAWIAFLGWLMFRRIDQVLTRQLGVGAGPALLGILVVALGTPYVFYTVREPFMVHAVSAFWCTEVVAVAVSPTLKARVAWPWLGFAVGMAIICRPTNVFLIPIVLYGVIRRINADGQATTLRTLPLALTGLIPVGLQLLCWKLLYGSWVAYSYGQEKFSWFRPHLLDTLISSYHGLFFFAPILLGAVWALLRRVREPLIGFWVLSGAILWYTNSSWDCWWFGDAFGARSFLELTGLFGVGLGLFFASLQGRPKLAIILAGVSILGTFVLMTCHLYSWLPHDAKLISWWI